MKLKRTCERAWLKHRNGEAYKEMRSADPIFYIVPEGYIELRRAREESVKKLFGAKYIVNFTPQSAKTEAIKNSRRWRWNAATEMLLRDFRSGKLLAYLLKDDKAHPLDRSHWHEFEPSYRPFSRDTLGVPGAPVYLMRCNDWQQWVAALPLVKRKKPASVAPKSHAADLTSRKQRRPGRPRGTGRYTGDASLVAKAEALLKSGTAPSILNAAQQVAGNPNAPTNKATVERLRRKIRDPRVGK